MRPILLICLVAFTAGCRRDRPGKSDRAAPVPSQVPTREIAHRLALAPPVGDGEVDRTIRASETLLEKAPQMPDAWIALGRAWIRKARETTDPGFYQNANACADVVLDMDPGNRLAAGLRAQVLLNDHRFDDARDAAERILARDPDDLVALAVLSDALLELGRYDEAEHAAQRMMDRKPNLAAYVRASHFRWLHGDFEGAKEAAWHALEGGVNRESAEPVAWATVQSAMLFWFVGDYAGADAGFDRALALVPDYPPALVGKGRVALAKGEGKRAVELLDKAHARSPLPETAWLLGDARAMAGDDDGAKKAWDLVVKDGRRMDHRTLALFLATKNRDAAEAVALAESEAKTRGGIYTDDALAWALHRAGRDAEAKVASDRALRLGTKDASLLFHAGAIRIALGDRAGGEKLVREALKTSPKFDASGAREAAALLGGS